MNISCGTNFSYYYFFKFLPIGFAEFVYKLYCSDCKLFAVIHSSVHAAETGLEVVCIMDFSR